ncbi:MAG: PEP-CTERM sorting domain-containing protein [Planctomycetes bacterium]|nr:PEP-CTERM sorting domain-containing protein [Planctomycetota bacterium]
MRKLALVSMVLMFATGVASGAVTTSTQHGPESTSLNGQIAVGDLISGQIGVEQAGDTGWHPAVSDPLDKLPAFTDDAGIRATGLTGLMNDFPGAGNPAKLVRYSLSGAKDVASIQILTGNNGKDGRVFSTTVVHYSTDNAGSFNMLGYFQSDPSGTINSGQWGSTLLQIYDDASLTLLAGVTHVQFDLYAVDNTGGQNRDPFDGLNPFTGADDGLSAAFVSPLVLELDVIEVPEPASLLLLAAGLFVCRRRVA